MFMFLQILFSETKQYGFGKAAFDALAVVLFFIFAFFTWGTGTIIFPGM